MFILPKLHRKSAEVLSQRLYCSVERQLVYLTDIEKLRPKNTKNEKTYTFTT